MNNIIKSILAVLCIVVASSNAFSQNVVRPKIAGPNDTWVNSYNGVLFFGRTDMETRNSAMPMQLNFYYNSSSNDVDYGYGIGFSLGYEMRYAEDDDGNVTILSDDGRSDVYERFGKEYQAPAGIFSVLSRTDDGKYTLTEKTGERYEFSDTIHRRVTCIYDRYDNATTLSYQDSLLISIQDIAGHRIEFRYTDGLMVEALASFQQGSYKYEYDGTRRLKKVTNPLGYSTLYGYTRENRINEITDANGNKTIIAYNNSGMVSRLKTDVTDKSIKYDGDKTVVIDYTLPSNQYSYYRWDDKGRVVEKVGLCCGTQSTMEYDIYDNVIRLVDGNGHSTDYTYDKNGNMLSLTDAAGGAERFTYEPLFNQVATYVDKNGNTYSFSYDSGGSLTSISGPLGFSVRNTYDSHGWLLTKSDANGNVTATTYNEDGSIASTMDAAGNITRNDYDSYGNLVMVTDALGNTTKYEYNALGNIVAIIDALGGVTTISYDKVGNIVRVKDALSHITAYSYNAIGNVVTKTDANGGVYRLEYDGKGNVVSVTDPLGRVDRFTYNDRNKRTSHTNAANETTSFDYDVKGNLMSISLPNGNIIGYEYDEADRVVLIDDNIGTIAEYTYDANGNKLTETDGEGRVITYTYDALNRKLSEQLPSGARTTFTYDNNSNILTSTDALGHTTTYTYSSLNQQLTHTDALNATTTFEYDGIGNLIKAIDAKNNPTIWTYDALGRNTQITFANGTSLQYGYNAVGNIINSVDRAGNASTYTYDNLGRILSQTYSDKSQDTFVYDAVGQLLEAVNPNATVTFSYDAAGRMLTESLNGKTTGYSYDIANGKRTYTYPSGMKIEERLNARDLISSILQNGTEIVSMSYNDAGQKSSQTFANGIISQFAYNEDGWLNSIADASNILNLTMNYDVIGNIIERKNLIDDNRIENYDYDAISQLISFKRGDSVDDSYQFDPLGNRTKSTSNGVVTNYTANNVNAYTAISGGNSFTPKYDGNGNLLNDGTHTFQYDLNNRMVSADNGTVTFKYDALGRRVAKKNISYYYVGDQMVEEFNGTSLVASYVYGNNIDEILQMKRGNDIYYYHTNHLGSTMALTDSKGNLVERIDYDAYGAPTFFDKKGEIQSSSTIGNNILFTGREYDAELGTYYFRARTQHPTIGRFMQHDPLLFINWFNDYSFVLNNPIILIDPTGTKITPISGVFKTLPLQDCTKRALSGAAQRALSSSFVAAAPLSPAGRMAMGLGAAGLIGYVGGWAQGKTDEGQHPLLHGIETIAAVALIGAGIGAMSAVLSGTDPRAGAIAGAIVGGVSAGIGYAQGIK